ncbi:glycerophosphoryl diester phosphodiesterase [Pontibacter aydingkolensis]|uniref:Glycerophosphodiester phosphodiesterase n=1 Tax=Pontibacter aydingkolensis TaxID=1911536 RepID=A0ABS7CSW9_9BACT|nr:glycerophosphodiester phosphodiesterase family protein [Pontibacter aydingkolensis]MBW7466587.1 glycerophosphodiester phosphodiesterase [Pontibacter aydingkolensis]
MKTTIEKGRFYTKQSRSSRWIILIAGVLVLGVFGFLYYPFGLGAKIKSDVLVLGHAGSGFMSPLNPFNPLPANSMSSIVKAMEEHGADGVEVDVQLSQDGVPILYHDVDLSSMTERSGLIENHKADDVVGLKYKGGFFYDLFHDEEIITLEAMLQRFASYPELPVLQIDLRNHNPERHLYYAQTLLAMLQKYDYPFQKLMFISPNPEFLEAFRQVNPQAPLMLDTGGDFDASLHMVLERNFQGICAEGKSASFEQIKKAKEQGVFVSLFGGKSRSRITKMIKLEPDAIQVNNVATMRDLLD